MDKLDFGSGYNPVDGFKTCDINGYVDYYFDPILYKIKTDDKFNYIRCRNVFHHIRDLKKLSKEFYRVLKDNGKLEIIEARKEYYNENYYLDYFWYRYVIPRYEVWFSNEYRDCREYFNIFTLEDYKVEGEKEIFIYKKKKG
jgi:ubiquinone/menaquinone biosynthesis C-methylase UbiE